MITFDEFCDSNVRMYCQDLGSIFMEIVDNEPAEAIVQVCERLGMDSEDMIWFANEPEEIEEWSPEEVYEAFVVLEELGFLEK